MQKGQKFISERRSMEATILDLQERNRVLGEDVSRLEGKVRSLENARMERVTGQDKAKKLVDSHELEAAKEAVVRL